MIRWPTLVLIAPGGEVVGGMSGEGIYEPFDEAIARIVHEADARGALDRRPLALRLEQDGLPEGVL